jgi:hypothetical protein
MDHEEEIKSLLAETIAIQAVLVHALRRLAKSDPDLWNAIAAGFDDAVTEVGNVALQRWGEANSESTLEALRIVEMHRRATLSRTSLSQARTFGGRGKAKGDSFDR